MKKKGQIVIANEPLSTVNPLISLPGGHIYFKLIWGERGGGGLIETGDLFNLAKKMVSIFQKEPKYKVEKLKFKTLKVMQPRIKNNSELPVGE